MNEIHRAFYHELGHFIAQEINQKYHEGPGVKEIVPFQSPANYDFFEAKTILFKNDFPTRERLLPYLASNTYGCIVQAYFKSQTLDECFKINGERDSRQWNKCITDHGLNGFQPDLFGCEKKYLQRITNNGELEYLKNLDPDKYLLKKDETNYSVDIKLLRSDLAQFIDSHTKVYSELLRDYQEAIDKG